ncbi:TPA: hypothetical protein VB881_000966 [Streptococcus suis]|nr:hypothetical protein [Streptococcus suis]
MTLTLFFLRKFGLTKYLAQSYSELGIELLDFFVKYEKFNKNLTRGKYNKICRMIYQNFVEIMNSNIFDEIFLLESVGANIEGGKLYCQTDSIEKFTEFLVHKCSDENKSTAAMQKAKDYLELYQQQAFEETVRNEMSRWNLFRKFISKMTIEMNDQLIIENKKIVKQLVESGLVTKVDGEFVLNLECLNFLDKFDKYFKINYDNYSFDVQNFIKSQKEIETDNEEISIKNFLESDFKNKELLLLRLEGNKYSTIAKITDTKEAVVRYRIKSTVQNKMPVIKEIEKYKSVYQDLNISKEVFTSIINSDGRVYELLRLLYKKGKTDVNPTNLLKYDNMLSESTSSEDVKLIDNEEVFETSTIQKNGFLLESAVSLDSFLESEFKHKDILLSRLNGNTLQQIGNQFGLTRERIRQILKKIQKSMPPIIEVNQFGQLFSEFDISREVFKKVFAADDRIYEFLNISLKKGKKSISTEILNGDYSDEIKEYILSLSNYMIIDGEIKKQSRENIIINVLKKYCDLQKYFKGDELMYLFSEENKKTSLQFKSIKSLESQLERYNHVIFSMGNGYRYHKFLVNDEISNYLHSIFSYLDDGAYNMDYVYKRHIDFFESIDILDGSELHNFIKKYNVQNLGIQLNRNPEFVKGALSKKEYVFSYLKLFNNQKTDQFLNFMNKKFGLHKGSLGAYISVEFGGYLSTSTIFITESNIIGFTESLKQYFTEEFYSLSVFEKIAKEHGIFPLSPEKIFALGFFQRGSIIIKNSYRGAIEALSTYILSHKIFKQEDNEIVKSSEYYNTIRMLETEYKILKITSDSFINVKYLENRGFDSNRLREFVTKVENFVDENAYFSVISILTDGLQTDLFDDGFSKISLDRLISTSDKFKAVSVGFPNIYCKSGIKKNLNDFLVDLLLDIKFVNVEDFTMDINNRYGIKLEEYDVRRRLIQQGIHYSEDLNKVYVYKEDFLKEVYGK